MYVAASSATCSIDGLARVVLVGDREDVVEDGEALVQLLARDRQRRRDHDYVPVDEEVEAARHCGVRHSRDRLGSLAAGVVGDQHLPRAAVADELQAPEEPLSAYVADRGMALCEAGQLPGEDIAHRGG